MITAQWRAGRANPGAGGAALRVNGVQRCRGADVYRHACERLGQRPSAEVYSDLCEHGALVVDLQLCHDAEAICLFLREAPAGTHQLVLYNGSHFFSTDERYRKKLRAVHRRAPPAGGALRDEGQLRHIIAALIVFCSMRGAGLAVLELTGLPLARQTPMLLTPLARCLSQLHMLQRLHLAGCGLNDRGFAALLPHLISSLPKLSRLSVARNGLRDVRLLTHFLQGRAAAQCRGAAVAMGVLDLSANPGLGAMRRSTAYSRWGRPLGRRPARPGHRRGVSRSPLVRVICEALQHGFLLRTLRLRSLSLSADDMRPLLELLLHEVACRQSGMAVAPPYDFSLAEVSLEGNPLEAEHVAAIMQLLSKLRETESWGHIMAGYPGFVPGEEALPPGEHLWEQWSSTPHDMPEMHQVLVQSQRSRSLPPPVVPKLEALDSERNAVSEGDAEFVDAEPDAFDHRNRFTRKKQLQDELSVLAASLRARHKTRPGRADSDMEKKSRNSSRSAARPHPQDRTQPRTAEQRNRGWSSEEVSSHRGPVSSSGGVRSSDRSSITLGAIPDRGLELGFGPPPGAGGFPAYGIVEPGGLWDGSSAEEDEEVYHSSRKESGRKRGSESNQMESRGHEEAADAAALVRPVPVHAPGLVPNEKMHAKLEMLHELFEQGARSGRAAAAGPEVLRCALDLISSEASLPADSEEAFELLAQRMADLQEAVSEWGADDEANGGSRHHGTIRHAEYMAMQAAAPQASSHSASHSSSRSSGHGGRRGHSSGYGAPASSAMQDQNEPGAVARGRRTMAVSSSA